MLSSAASLVLVLAPGPQLLQKHEASVWQSVRPSVVVLIRNGLPFGQAALIDKRGLFLATQSAVTTPTIQARLADGRMVTLDWKSTDVPTQTVLLQAEEWELDTAPAVTIHQPEDRLAKTPVLVVLPSGPIRGELIATDRVGVLSSSRRMFPLAEVRFEKTAQPVAGALVFDEQGHLAGILNATLESQEPVSIQRIAAPSSKSLMDAFRSGVTPARNDFGPGEVTVGYTVGPEVLRRVVGGFLSPSHKVPHPAIGVFCKDAGAAGAMVQQVRAGSPAEEAGIQVGDVIVKMDDQVIHNQFDFARVIESKEVGDSITLVVIRNLAPRTMKLTVGTTSKTQSD